MSLRAPVVIVLACLAVVLAACGGGGSKSANRGYRGYPFKSPVGGQSAPRGYASPTYNSYTPTGKIVADDGFRPWDNGFSFENYGNDAGPTNMTPANMYDLFGPQVCISGSGDSCSLTGPAAQWMASLNDGMAGGHCMGFSVTALRMFSGGLSPGAFGAATVPKLPLVGNDKLQSMLAEGFSYQALPSVQAGEIGGDANNVLDHLTAALKSGRELYTMLIFGENGKPGGHAITPFAVEDQGGGHFNVLVYDNNFPDVTRTVKFDRNKDTWEYRGGINPSDLNEKYGADGPTTKAQKLLRLAPTKAGEGVQPFAFAGDVGSGSAGSTAGGQVAYDQISLKGSVDNHAHLLIKDTSGHEMGYDKGQLVNTIPGANILRPVADQINVNQLPEPTYEIPPGIKVQVHINGDGLTKVDDEQLTYISKGVYFQVQHIQAHPGDHDLVELKGGGGVLIYSTDNTTAATPYLAAGLVDTDHGRRAAYAFVIKAIDVKGASNIGLVFLPQQHFFGAAAVALHHKADFGYGKYVMVMDRETENSSLQWVSTNVNIQGPAKGRLFGEAEVGAVALVPYNQKDWTKADKVPVHIVNEVTYKETDTAHLSFSK